MTTLLSDNSIETKINTMFPEMLIGFLIQKRIYLKKKRNSFKSDSELDKRKKQLPFGFER